MEGAKAFGGLRLTQLFFSVTATVEHLSVITSMGVHTSPPTLGGSEAAVKKLQLAIKYKEDLMRPIVSAKIQRSYAQFE